MRLRDMYKEYKLRHLKIGRVKNLDKKNPSDFQIEKISWEVSWQTGLYLAVIIRDYLRFFIKNTQVVGNCVVEDYEVYRQCTDEDADKYAQKWEDRVNSVADEFDELIKMLISDELREDVSEFNKKQKALEKKAFNDLSEIFDDLWW